jgi:hypothetical protein
MEFKNFIKKTCDFNVLVTRKWKTLLRVNEITREKTKGNKNYQDTLSILKYFNYILLNYQISQNNYVLKIRDNNNNDILLKYRD